MFDGGILIRVKFSVPKHLPSFNSFKQDNNNKCDFNSSLTMMSGTSMATPAVAGSMALIYQYLNESIHGLPKDKSKNITSALLRALAVASAVMHHLRGDKESVSSLIKNKETHLYFIRTDSVCKLRILIAWIDVPLNPESDLPLFSYCDLTLIGPDGKVYDN